MAFRCYNDDYHPAFRMAFQVAGEAIETFKTSLPEGDGEVPDFRWLVTQPQMLFAHIVFAYRNQVFAVYVSVEDEGESSFTERHRTRLLNAADEFNLIPCEFKVQMGPWMKQPNGVYGQAMKAAVDGLGLIHVRTGEKIDLVAMTSDVQVEMSEWERRAFAIQVVRNRLKENPNVKQLEGCCSVIDIDPQVWFQDQEGRMCWCIVREWVGEDENAPTKEDFYDFIKNNDYLKPYDGFFIGVSIVSMALVVYDAEGNIIPLSQRFTPTCSLYRGDPLTVKMTPLERVYVAEY